MFKAESAPGVSAAASENEAASAQGTVASVVTHRATTGHKEVICTRVLLETSGSFRSFEAWAAAVAPEMQGTRERCTRLVGTMAEFERRRTYKLVNAGSVFRLMADGTDRFYQIELGAVIWTLPRDLTLEMPVDQLAWLHQLGPKGRHARGGCSPSLSIRRRGI